jgi:hypothetical protein
MSAMEELETLLQSLQALKPPGVTKTKIESITTLCIQNIQVCSAVPLFFQVPYVCRMLTSILAIGRVNNNSENIHTVQEESGHT